MNNDTFEENVFAAVIAQEACKRGFITVKEGCIYLQKAEEVIHLLRRIVNERGYLFLDRQLEFERKASEHLP